MAGASKPVSEIKPIEFASPAKQAEEAAPEINFDELSPQAKQDMLASLKATLSETRDGLNGPEDISPLMRNVEDLVNGRTTADLSQDAWRNKLEQARNNLKNQMDHIELDRYPPCDDRLTVKLPKSAKKHLMSKALAQDMTLSEYVIQALNVVGELEGDDKIILVAPRGHFLQSASRARGNRS